MKMVLLITLNPENMRIEIEVEELLILEKFSDWVNKCPDRLPSKKYSKNEFIFIDNYGFFLETGADFQSAKDKGHFPVTVYRKVLTRNAYDSNNELNKSEPFTHGTNCDDLRTACKECVIDYNMWKAAIAPGK